VGSAVVDKARILAWFAVVALVACKDKAQVSSGLDAEDVMSATSDASMKSAKPPSDCVAGFNYYIGYYVFSSAPPYEPPVAQDPCKVPELAQKAVNGFWFFGAKGLRRI
jgi:hypothetical protein